MLDSALVLLSGKNSFVISSLWPLAVTSRSLFLIIILLSRIWKESGKHTLLGGGIPRLLSAWEIMARSNLLFVAGCFPVAEERAAPLVERVIIAVVVVLVVAPDGVLATLGDHFSR